MGHHNRLSVGTDGGPFFEEGTKNSQGRRAVVSESKQPAARPAARDVGETLEVEEGRGKKLKRDFSFFLIIMQGRV